MRVYQFRHFGNTWYLPISKEGSGKSQRESWLSQRARGVGLRWRNTVPPARRPQWRLCSYQPGLDEYKTQSGGWGCPRGQGEAMELVDDQMCFVCGKKNPAGLHLDFELVGQTQVRTSFLPTPAFQGFRDIVHGGIIATILDEVMVNGCWLRGVRVVTGKLEVRLRRPARVDEREKFPGTIRWGVPWSLWYQSLTTSAEGVVVAE